ncbi:hypothetical protein SAMN05444354_1047 [Stigmatella aurantiaca]|uniref:ASCH domain-containing protein n=1 Tax=Stigmatella aurantiaca TaxID=41 RepID=A0A1H7MIZ3_STIAU|nr:hypothetical protein [Stigmatella aurantiaca]SEL11223.1 hypothetical protein SAMN05444354_1047 [Stigmatella aurantiaca]
MSTSVAALLERATDLQALTLWQPWAWAVATPEVGKDVENRGWEPPPSALGRPLAIHAGLTYDADSAASIAEELGVRVPGKAQCVRGTVVAVAVLARAEAHSRSRWWISGNVAWCLEGTVALPRPVPCKGAQGLWRLPPEALAQVRAQVLEALAPAAPTRVSGRVHGGSSRGGPAVVTGAVTIRGGQVVPCEDCRRPILGYGPRPHRHGGYLLAREVSAPDGAPWPDCGHGERYRMNCLGKPEAPPCCTGTDGGDA